MVVQPHTGVFGFVFSRMCFPDSNVLILSLSWQTVNLPNHQIMDSYCFRFLNLPLSFCVLVQAVKKKPGNTLNILLRNPLNLQSQLHHLTISASHGTAGHNPAKLSHTMYHVSNSCEHISHFFLSPYPQPLQPLFLLASYARQPGLFLSCLSKFFHLPPLPTNTALVYFQTIVTAVLNFQYQNLYPFSLAAVKKCHRYSGFKWRPLIISQFCRSEAWIGSIGFSTLCVLRLK